MQEGNGHKILLQNMKWDSRNGSVFYVDDKNEKEYMDGKRVRERERA